MVSRAKGGRCLRNGNIWTEFWKHDENGANIGSIQNMFIPFLLVQNNINKKIINSKNTKITILGFFLFKINAFVINFLYATTINISTQLLGFQLETSSHKLYFIIKKKTFQRNCFNINGNRNFVVETPPKKHCRV